ncbi:MAG: cytochrome c3 family protein [Burkholderiales bacterium]|jgi:c(7)-type cytochrome triheme protein
MKRAGYIIGIGALLAVLASAVADPVVGDIVFVRKVKGSDDVAPAIFPHWVHRVKYKCYACHNKTVGFALKAGTTPIDMDSMEAGKYCGECHKGKPAFAVTFETCNRCHRK